MAFEHDIPWTLVRVESNDQTVVLRYPIMLAPGVDVRLATVAVDMDDKTVAITLTEQVRTEASSGLTGVYFDTRETTVILDEPLRGRGVSAGHVDADMDAYREVLRSADREARSTRP